MQLKKACGAAECWSFAPCWGEGQNLQLEHRNEQVPGERNQHVASSPELPPLVPQSVPEPRGKAGIWAILQTEHTPKSLIRTEQPVGVSKLRMFLGSLSEPESVVHCTTSELHSCGVKHRRAIGISATSWRKSLRVSSERRSRAPASPAAPASPGGPARLTRRWRRFVMLRTERRNVGTSARHGTSVFGEQARRRASVTSLEQRSTRPWNPATGVPASRELRHRGHSSIASAQANTSLR